MGGIQQSGLVCSPSNGLAEVAGLFWFTLLSVVGDSLQSGQTVSSAVNYFLSIPPSWVVKPANP